MCDLSEKKMDLQGSDRVHQKWSLVSSSTGIFACQPPATCVVHTSVDVPYILSI